MNEDQNQELPRMDETKKTRELCGSERDGFRCMRPKDHKHQHASYGLPDTVIWE